MPSTKGLRLMLSGDATRFLPPGECTANMNFGGARMITKDKGLVLLTHRMLVLSSRKPAVIMSSRMHDEHLQIVDNHAPGHCPSSDALWHLLQMMANKEHMERGGWHGLIVHPAGRTLRGH